MDINTVDRSSFSIGSLHEEGNDKEYWQSKSSLERLQAVELMRKIIYGYNSSERLLRFFEIAEFRKAEHLLIRLLNLEKLNTC